MTFLLIGHIIGLAMGAGGAAMSDILFLTSMADGFLDPLELRLLKRASRLVIAGLVLLIITGIGFLFVREDGVGQRFWAKMTIVAILTINGMVMHWKLFPLLETLARGQVSLLSPLFWSRRRLFVWTGAVSIVSWYAALVLGAWRSLELSYGAMMGIYGVGVLLTAVVGHHLFNYLLSPPVAKDPLEATPTSAQA